MSLISLIQQHAAEAAEAGDWVAVATALNAATIEQTSQGRKTTMSLTLAALMPQEIESTLVCFARTELGKCGLATLAAKGLDFAHPLTVGLIESMRGDLPVGVADKLLRLGQWRESPADALGLGEVTPDQCREAYSSDRLAARITNANALANERLVPSQSPEEQVAVWIRAWQEAV
jgi:hypothetical protein